MSVGTCMYACVCVCMCVKLLEILDLENKFLGCNLNLFLSYDTQRQCKLIRLFYVDGTHVAVKILQLSDEFSFASWRVSKFYFPSGPFTMQP